MNNPGPASHPLGQQPHQFVKGVGFGANGVKSGIVLARPGSDGQLRQVINVHRLRPVLATAGDGEHREAPQQPSDVVEQNVSFAKYQGWPDYGVGQGRFPDRLLHQTLAPEVGQRRINRGISDTDMHQPPDAGLFRRPDESTGVLHRPVKGDIPAGETDPVGIVKGVRPAQALGQGIRPVEVKGESLDSPTERVFADTPGQSAYRAAQVQQPVSNVPARVAESAGNYIKPGIVSGMRTGVGVIHCKLFPVSAGFIGNVGSWKGCPEVA